jgi:uncharacterized protein
MIKCIDENVILVPKSEYHTTQWSGGSTTELLIFPSTASYKEKNFKWRVSSATIDVDESNFTYLPNISRHLIIIDGKIILNHQDKYKKVLEPYDQDYFMGDWTTKSFGKATDFNLMLAKGYTGNLQVLTLKKDSQVNIVQDGNSTEVFYIVSGTLSLEIVEEKHTIIQGDLFYISDSFDYNKYEVILLNDSQEEIIIIRASISLND